MTKAEVYAEIEQIFGSVPSFFKIIPENSLVLEWQLFKTLQLAETPIPAKYKELIGIGIAAVTKCRYCALFHTEAAKLNGATPEEIEDAVHFAKSSAGWSAYLNGMQVDYDEFKEELLAAMDYARKNMAA
jgi:AhpD family alkylhydroperoxidase